MTERMYADLAEYWPLLSPPEEYREEAALYERVLRQHAASEIRTMLELGSGGGHNASHLKQAFCRPWWTCRLACWRSRAS
jgi:hypothetical protein